MKNKQNHWKNTIFHTFLRPGKIMSMAKGPAACIFTWFSCAAIEKHNFPCIFTACLLARLYACLPACLPTCLLVCMPCRRPQTRKHTHTQTRPHTPPPPPLTQTHTHSHMYTHKHKPITHIRWPHSACLLATLLAS